MKPDEELLEPILPKSPPTAPDPASSAGDAGTDGPVEAASGRGGDGPSWERLVLVGCAVVATLCLVVISLRLSSIAKDQQVQSCQTRVFAEQQFDDFRGSSGRASQQRYARELAECVGVELPADADED